MPQPLYLSLDESEELFIGSVSVRLYRVYQKNATLIFLYISVPINATVLCFMCADR